MQASDSAQEELEEFQEESLPERAFSERGPLNPKLRRYKDSNDELTLDKKAHSEKGAAKYHDEEWSPCAPSAPPMASTAGDATQMDMQLSKLEFEIKMQKLTNELRKLKTVSSTEKNSYSETYQSLLKRAVSQALGKGQDTSEVPAFPILEVIDQQNNRVRQYQTLEFKVIKELKAAVVQYGPTAPFTQALLDTVMESNLTPKIGRLYVRLLCQEEISYFGVLSGVKPVRKLPH